MWCSRVTTHPLARIRQNLHTIRECYGVARIGFFGSVVRNEETPASDMDILMEFREGRRPSITSWISNSLLRISAMIQEGEWLKSNCDSPRVESGIGRATYPECGSVPRRLYNIRIQTFMGSHVVQSPERSSFHPQFALQKEMCEHR